MATNLVILCLFAFALTYICIALAPECVQVYGVEFADEFCLAEEADCHGRSAQATSRNAGA